MTGPISQLESTLVWRSYRFNINDAFDPDESNIGHQPRGFDQWASLYQGYIVRGCRYECEVQASSNSGLTTLTPDIYTFINIAPSGVFIRDHGSSTGIDSIIEGPKDKYTQWKRQERQASYVLMPNTNTQSRSGFFKGFVNMKRFYNDFRGYSVAVGSGAMTEMQWPQNYMAQTNMSPLALCEMNVGAGSCTTGANTEEGVLPLIQLRVRLVMYIEFFNPLMPSYSNANVGVTGATGTGAIGGTGYIFDGVPFDRV